MAVHAACFQLGGCIRRWPVFPSALSSVLLHIFHSCPLSLIPGEGEKGIGTAFQVMWRSLKVTLVTRYFQSEPWLITPFLFASQCIQHTEYYWHEYHGNKNKWKMSYSASIHTTCHKTLILCQVICLFSGKLVSILQTHLSQKPCIYKISQFKANL